MDKKTIEYLAYLLDKAKNEGKDRAIVFLGAGASVSAGIPLTGVIVRHIRLKFRKNPLIQKYVLNGKTDYYELMALLTADERRDLFHFYVTRDKVKLNIANVYLAQLLKLGYVDYIVTVNFDDLILKACTIFNFLPPVYDISNIKTITTTDIRTGSVLYLHGQYFGQWLLNNKEELEKVENEVLALFNSIKTRRTWIVIGYSGNDGIFDKIKSLGSFSNDFFWVKKELNPKDDEHVIEFLNTPNNNVHSIEGFYADTFFLKLHAELTKLDKSLNPPDIFFKPFTFIKSAMQNVNEVDGDDDLNAQVKNLINICNERVDKAIEQFEDKDSLEDFKQSIINALIKKEFSDDLAGFFENKIKENNFKDAKIQLSGYYNGWGSLLLDLGRKKSDSSLFLKSFDKFQKSIKLNPKNESTLNNYGVALTQLAKLNSDPNLYREAIDKFKKSIEIEPKKKLEYMNYGTALLNLFHLENDFDLLKSALDVSLKAYNFGGSPYNLSCTYALLGDKAKALKYLDETLEKGLQVKEFVLKDIDWQHYIEDEDFKALLAKY